jgi:hypothetical protein
MRGRDTSRERTPPPCEREQKHINKTARRGAHFLKAIDGTATRKKSRKSLFHGE